ncbi:hypothetical protein NIES970_27740 (plasmid) [[Synechococcus] sp. NIES-970]|nr:hypothetical protein NIES970_27740 [[Synechococcus] sp. NIES-970]
MMSPQQFVLLVGAIALAIVGGGVWLIYASLNPFKSASDQAEIRTTAETETDSSFSFTENIPADQTGTPLATPTEAESIWRAPYNVVDPLMNFPEDPTLQNIVAQIRALAQRENLPPERMSVVLVDLNRQAIASYRSDTFHYPASVPKLFWLVALYGQFDQGLLNPEVHTEDLALMVQQSDNNATSRLIDAMTRTTQSLTAATPADFATWRFQREQLNVFFQTAGYEGLDITQKTYPITDVEIFEPAGFDLQMRENSRNPDRPLRNRLSAYQAARLMTEIAQGQAIDPEASQQMLAYLQRDLTQDWQSPKDYFNPVQNFFGEGLPPEMRIFSKAGWMSQGRHEVAYIVSPDERQRFILSVFADHSAYSENETFFPAIAKLIHEQINLAPDAAQGGL